MKNRIKFILLTCAAVLMTTFVPLSFIFGGKIQSLCEKVLHLYVNEDLAGGKIIRAVYDKSGDDKGSGAFSYPLSPLFAQGSLDIIKYTAHENVTDYRSGSYMQCGIVLGAVCDDEKFPFGCVRISIYIDVDGNRSGSVTGLEGDEDVSFDPDYPWDFALIIDGYNDKPLVHFADSSDTIEATAIFMRAQRRIVVRIPLNTATTGKLLAQAESRHYVFTKGYDKLSLGNVVPVKEFESVRSGGGRTGDEANVYDYLDEPLKNDTAAAAVLNQLQPVIISKKFQNAAMNIDKLQQEYDNYTAEEKRRGLEALANCEADKDSFEYGLALFNAGKTLEAESRMTGDTHRIQSLAYRGAIQATKAATTKNLLESVELVNSAYVIMDEACSNATEDIDVITALLCRANTSLAVPEDVFGKSAQAVEDFKKAAKMLAQIEGYDSSGISDILVKAALCAERAGNTAECERLFIEAASLGYSPYGKLEAAKRGIIF